MLTGIAICLVGGDARQVEITRIFSEMDASVRLLGFDNMQNHYSGVVKVDFDPTAFENVDAVVLPPVGTDDIGRIDSIFSTENLQLTEAHIKALPAHATVYTGMANSYLKKLCSGVGIPVVELLERDDVAIYNSIPTAEGAIMMAIQNTDITLHHSNSIVLGMGRTGLTLARTLYSLGANVRMGVYKPEQYARAFEMGYAPFYTEELSMQVSDADLIFNTIPHMIITAQVISHIPHRAVIIDLASKPGGTDFRFAEKRGIKALLAPGLPGIVAPKTAGQIIARTLSSLILEDTRKRGNV